MTRASAPRLAAVITTCNRPLLLANRSLPSVAAQSRPPDLVVIVDDSAWRARHVNQDIVASWRCAGTRVTYLDNWRSRGAAGAWNTALHYLHRETPGTWVALLDDDDSWEPRYLEACLTAGVDQDADVVVAGLVRRTGVGPDYRHAVPEVPYRSVDFLVGNPHWQGSNTFARLEALLAAGVFDESFDATNDRDLGLRLLDLPWLRWTFVRQHLVVHHAEPGAERLSTRGSLRKRAGLAAFHEKYRGRMTPDVRAAALARTRELFGIHEDELALPTPSPAPPPRSASGPRVPAILVGTISSPGVEVTLGFLDAVVELAAGAPETQVELVVLDNGGPDAGVRDRLRARVARFEGETRIRCTLLPALGIERASIAVARTHLQRGCHAALAGRRIPVWLLDDDVRFDIPTDAGDRIDWGFRPDHLAWVTELAATGADVVIGSVTGEPPLPFASTVRVQVVDLLHNLEWMSGLARSDTDGLRAALDAPLQSRHAENMALRQRYRDYYYDLSRVDTGQLERPFWYEPRTSGATLRGAFTEMVDALDGVHVGRQIFRPLLWAQSEPARALLPGFQRGPNTLVFRPECLVELPNAAPRLAGQHTRRSDMNWALLGHHVNGWHVVTAPFPVRQSRDELNAAQQVDHRNLILDIRGYAVFSALQDLLLEKRTAQQSRGEVRPGLELLELDADELALAMRKTEKYLQERLVAWETGHIRVAALARALESYVSRAADRGRSHFWLEDAAFAPQLERLAKVVRRLRRDFEGPHDAVSRAVLDFERAELARFFTKLGDEVRRFRSQVAEMES